MDGTDLLFAHFLSVLRCFFAAGSTSNFYIDTVTLYLAGGTTPPPSVPTFFFQPYKFASPGLKSVRIAAWDGCMSQVQTIAVTASCRALTSQSTWVFPALAPGAALPTLMWSPVNVSGSQNGYGRWWSNDLYNLTAGAIEGAYAGSSGYAAGTLGFYVSTKGSYTDSLTLLDGSTTTTAFNPAWTWNSLSIAVTPTAAPITALLGLAAMGSSSSCSATVNISTTMGTVGNLGITGFSNTRRTLSYGFAYDGPIANGAPAPWLDPSLPATSTRFGGIIHSCPRQSSPVPPSYVRPIYAVSAVTPTGYQLLIPSSYTMLINCTALGVAQSDPYRYAQGVTGAAIVIGATSYSGIQASGSFVFWPSKLPPSNLGYALHVQSNSAAEGTFEQTTAIDNGCIPFGWSDLSSAQYAKPLPGSNVSSPIGLRPTFASALNYAITVSDGCAQSTTTVAVPVTCDAFVPSLTWLSNSAAAITVYANIGNFQNAWSTLSVLYSATYPSGLLLTPTTSGSRNNSLDVYLYVAAASGVDASVVALDSAVNTDAANTHNVLSFTPPRVGTYTIGALGTDGCYESFATPITVTALCPTLTATTWQFTPDPDIGLSASTPWKYIFRQSSGAQNNTDGNDIYPVAGLAVNLTQTKATTLPWTSMTNTAQWYTVTVLANGVTASGSDYLLARRFTLSSIGTYVWDFTMYKVATWTISFTFYDNSCVTNNVASNQFCGQTSATFTVASQCNNNGAGTPPFNFAPNSIWLLADTNSNTNVTDGTGSIVYNYDNNAFGVVYAFPPVSITDVTGNSVFSAPTQVIKEAAIGFKVVNGAYGFSPASYSVIRTVKGKSAPFTSAQYAAYNYFAFALPNGVGAAVPTGNAIDLSYAVYDGCQVGELATPFRFYAICNRTLSSSAVVAPAATYWQGAANKFQVRVLGRRACSAAPTSLALLLLGAVQHLGRQGCAVVQRDGRAHHDGWWREHPSQHDLEGDVGAGSLERLAYSARLVGACRRQHGRARRPRRIHRDVLHDRRLPDAHDARHHPGDLPCDPPVGSGVPRQLVHRPRRAGLRVDDAELASRRLVDVPGRRHGRPQRAQLVDRGLPRPLVQR